MKLNCPNCGYTKEVDESKIPPGAKKATCPKCRTKFDIFQAPPSPAEEPLAFLDEEDEPPTIADVPPRQPADEQPGRPAAARSEPLEETVAGPSMREYEEETRSRRPGGPAPEPPPLPAGGAFAQEEGPTEDIPWESRTGGFFSDLLSTSKMVLFSPSLFFRSMPITGGYGRPLVFAMVTGTIGAIFAVFYQYLMVLLGMGGMGGMQGMNQLGPMGDSMSMFMGIGLVAVVILTPIMIMIGMFVFAAIAHFFLMIVRGSGGGYQATFRALSYSSAAQLLNIIPILGQILGGIWGLIVAIIGLARAHDTGVFRIIFGLIILPFLLIVALGIGAAILIPALVHTGM